MRVCIYIYIYTHVLLLIAYMVYIVTIRIHWLPDGVGTNASFVTEVSQIPFVLQ